MASNNYNLEERTTVFAETIIDFCKSIKLNPLTVPIVSQLIRSGTSIGANYAEASGASSKKDFQNKLHICLKETKETKYWLRMTAKVQPQVKEQARLLWNSAHELMLIFSKALSTLKKKS